MNVMLYISTCPQGARNNNLKKNLKKVVDSFRKRCYINKVASESEQRKRIKKVVDMNEP